MGIFDQGYEQLITDAARQPIDKPLARNSWIYRGLTRITDSSKQSGPVWYSRKSGLMQNFESGAIIWPVLKRICDFSLDAEIESQMPSLVKKS